MSAESFQCRMCGSKVPGKSLSVREMMYGSREAFDYVECSSCASLQIRDIPSDLSRHYPDDYYSMDESGAGRSRLARGRSWLVRRLYQTYTADIGVLRKLLPAPHRGDVAALAAAGVRKSDSILDVGCGAGAEFLRLLAKLGFTRLQGADPFIEQDEIRHGSVVVRKRFVKDIDERFDVVTMNHSLEHVPDPAVDLTHVARILKPNGKAIVRIPTVSSTAYDVYQADWVQLDAPRHLNLPSRQAMKGLFERAGLTLERTFDDSTALQFSGSELYRRDIPLRSFEAYTAYDRRQLSQYKSQADALNRAHRGDQAVFIARK